MFETSIKRFRERAARIWRAALVWGRAEAPPPAVLWHRFKASRFIRHASNVALAFDSWIDSSIYGSGERAKQNFEAFVMFMDRFHVAGGKRLAVELACEGLTIGCAGGVLALALAMPAFQLTSDDWLKKQDLAVTFLDRYGQEAGRRGIRHDDAVPFDELPRTLIQAVISTEDRRFFDHFGIDVIGTMRALTVNARAEGVVQGGSSLTQQLAKNLFLSSERSVQRKINEAFLAMWLEGHLSKREILSLYLDRAYLGGGTFGVQAASEFYFGKSVRDLTLQEAAMIAGLFKAPTKYAPHINLPAARARANDVLNNMVDAGYLPAGQVYPAQHNPATPVDRKRETNPDWYLDWAFNEVKAMAQAGRLGDDRVLTVRLALDPAIQRHSEETIENQLREHGPAFHVKESAAVVLEPGGAVRAIVGGRDYGGSQFNRAIDALRQPGSSFKPFVYLTALMSGKVHPNTIVSGEPICLGNWCPQNFGGAVVGHMPLVNALTRSLNTVAVRLSVMIGDGNAKAGRAKIIATAKRLGITTRLEDTPSLPLGADVVNPMEMAAAYAGFASGGKRIYPYAAVSIANSRGDEIYRHDRDAPAPLQVVDAHAVQELIYMLHQNVLGGTGTAAAIEGHDAAGKTGTTNESRDAWFDGFTSNLAGVVWYGNDDNSPTNGMTGASLPAKTWHEIMAFAHQNLEPKPLFGQPMEGGGRVATQGASSGSVISLAGNPREFSMSKGTADALNAIQSAAQIIRIGQPAPKPPQWTGRSAGTGRSAAGDAAHPARIIELR